MLSCPLELEILLHYFYSAGDLFYNRSKAADECADKLIEAGMLETMPHTVAHVRITDKGRFFVKHLLTIKFPEPVNTFVIPE